MQLPVITSFSGMDKSGGKKETVDNNFLSPPQIKNYHPGSGGNTNGGTILNLNVMPTALDKTSLHGFMSVHGNSNQDVRQKQLKSQLSNDYNSDNFSPSKIKELQMRTPSFMQNDEF